MRDVILHAYAARSLEQQTAQADFEAAARAARNAGITNREFMWERVHTKAGLTDSRLDGRSQGRQVSHDS